MMKQTVVSTITGLALTILILCVSVCFVAYSHTLHSVFLDDSQATRVDANITSFLLSGDKTLLSNINLTHNETSHMVDVYNLLRTFKYIGVVSFIVLGLSFCFKPNHYSLIIPGVMYSGIVSLVQFAGIIGFTSFFEIFHRVFFPMGNYSFPFSSTLIQTYSEVFFLSLGIITVACYFLITTAVYAAAYVLKKRYNHRK